MFGNDAQLVVIHMWICKMGVLCEVRGRGMERHTFDQKHFFFQRSIDIHVRPGERGMEIKHYTVRDGIRNEEH